jgi:EAL domain-containing protein (putative c-di-GMP-specific phosphodiesterase class I)
VLVALNGIARRIGAQVIAEGIETPEQLETLKGLAVPYGQGYFLGRATRFDPGEAPGD